MLTFIISLLSLFPVCFISSYRWVVLPFYLGFLFFCSVFFIYRGIVSFYRVCRFICLDSIRSLLVLLSIWITCIIYICSYKIEYSGDRANYFLFVVYSLLVVLIFTFRVVDFIYFYLLFEVSLIPTLLLIIGWGYQPERLQAGVYIIIYTITGSLPLLGGLLYIYIDVGSLCIFYNMGYRFSLGVLGPFL